MAPYGEQGALFSGAPYRVEADISGVEQEHIEEKVREERDVALFDARRFGNGVLETAGV